MLFPRKRNWPTEVYIRMTKFEMYRQSLVFKNQSCIKTVACSDIYSFLGFC